jgi:NADPH-dependent 2,4-dienoyl-CoA reductase/sulfur reductase-like enzyme/rhodanese-related sulfurtransferase
MDIVIVGGGAAGLKAAARARRRDAEANITVVEAGKYVSMARCGLPYFVGGLIHEIDNLRETTYGVVRDEEYFRKLMDVEVLTLTRAIEIDRNRKIVKVSRNGSEDELNYDYLVLSTGARPVRPPIDGLDGEGVFNLFDPEDAERIVDFWMENEPQKAVVIGAGLIGLESSEALVNLDIDVTVVELMDQIVPGLLDQEMARYVQEHLVEKGVKILTSTKVEKVIGDSEKRVMAGGKEIPADIILVAAGVKPNVELARKAGLKIGDTGAISVNDRLQTSDPHIFAGGDCVENIHLLTGKKVYVPLGSTANKHGRVIGTNVTGGDDRFPGILGTTIFKIFDYTVGRTGLTEKQALDAGINAVSVLVPGPDRAHYYPGVSYIRFKLVVDAETRKIIGAQCAGSGAVDKRIDVIVTAVSAGMTIDTLSNLDLAYAPPYSTALDVVITAANTTRNKLEGLYESIKPDDLRRKIDAGEEVVLLDVRSEEEVRQRKLEIGTVKVVNIPILELRDRVNELPKDEMIVTVCQVGLRSYVAARILRGIGFKNVRALEGGVGFLF